MRLSTDEAARGGAGEGSDQARQLVPGQPLLTDGGIRRNGGSSRLIRDQFPLGPVAFLVGCCTTPGRSGRKSQIVTIPEPKSQMTL
jgi:hypothetical protein